MYERYRFITRQARLLFPGHYTHIMVWDKILRWKWLE